MKIYASTGPFAGDKDAAAYIRTTYVRRGVERGEKVILDFANVRLATQSFIHALIADVVRGDASCLDQIEFKNCNVEIQTVIEIVVAYAQEWVE
ncbi:STAS-like domain-containing protein [Microbacterium sp. bgisy189]|uniref:STAS-like domain-containing protein n=1 Tax=Microbacterium sp. bgisy189 TaxID=3413798 RepID=UPI003EBFFB95